MTAAARVSPADLVAHLDTLRQSAPDCRLVAYCDLDTQLVLRHAAEPGVRQEVLDRLSQEAAEAFRLHRIARATLPPNCTPLLGETEDIRLIDDRGVRLFLRLPEAPQDALILLCASSEGADQVQSVATGLLQSAPSEPRRGHA